MSQMVIIGSTKVLKERKGKRRYGLDKVISGEKLKVPNIVKYG